MGRPVTELAHIYSIECNKLLSHPQCIGDFVHVSLIDQLSLQEYIVGRTEYYNRNHTKNLFKEYTNAKAATITLHDGFCLLLSAFKV